MSALYSDLSYSNARFAFAETPFLDPDCIIPRLSADTKIAAVKELLDRLYDAGIVQDSLGFLQALLERENLQSTIVGPGIAMPHARTRAVSRLGVALGLARPAIDYPSGDERGPVQVICLVAAPVDNPGAFLRLQAQLARGLADPALEQATDAAEICRLLAPVCSAY